MSFKENEQPPAATTQDSDREVMRLRAALQVHRKQQLENISRAVISLELARSLHSNLQQIGKDMREIGAMLARIRAGSEGAEIASSVLLAQVEDQVAELIRRTDFVLADDDPTALTASTLEVAQRMGGSVKPLTIELRKESLT